MQRSLRLLLGLVAVTVIVACGPSESSDDPSNSAWGITTLVEDLRIGRSEGPSEYLFGSINGILQHPDGTVFIADRQVPVIRRYDGAGTYMHDVGREGQGPGEYQVLQEMKLLPDGNLTTWDPRAQRVTVFEPDGTWVKDFEGESRLFAGRPTFWVDREGNSYVLTTKREDGVVERYPPQLLLKYSADGELLDEIVGPSREAETEAMVMATGEGYLPNFSKTSVMTLGKSGHLVVGHNGSYSFEIRDGDEVLIEVEHEWEPVPVHPEEQAQWNARQDEIMQRFRDRPSDFVNMDPPEFAPIPDTKPAYMDLWTGEDGTIWVRRYAAARERDDLPPRDPDSDRPPFTWFQYPTFDVFGQEGEFLGTVVLPNDTRMRWFHSDYIWTVRPDENDEDVAVRYRIQKQGDAGS